MNSKGGLSDYEKDILKELSTIGSGNAATSISVLIRKTVNISVPSLTVVEPKKFGELIGKESDIRLAIFSYITENYPSKFIVLLSLDEANRLSDLLIHQKFKNIDFNDEKLIIFKSMLLELGNILISSYINAISEIIHKTLVHTPPQIKYDFLESIIDEFSIINEEEGKEMLFLKNEFAIEGSQFLFDLLFLPDDISIRDLIKGV
ncbi:chemotaxis protein CheC [bacterium]|nr:chemotaxis protein CheC [bacterium]